MCVRRRVAVLLACGLAGAPAFADHLIFGSFRSSENATNWAQKLSTSFMASIYVAEFENESGLWYRVRSTELNEAALQALARRARSSGVQYWKRSAEAASGEAGAALAASRAEPPLGGARLSPPSRVVAAEERRPVTTVVERRVGVVEERLEWDVGLQSRAFSNEGAFGQDRLEASLSLQIEYVRSWDRDRQSFTATPFLRIDSADSERSHGDLREFFYTRVGDSWDLHIGAKRVFWGVTEFHHLIDVINQTDLVENIDTEDKLGQPMVQLSLVRDWGILDFYALPYFRERAFPSEDGRLRMHLPILDDDPLYESGREERHLDAAVRWSHYVGPWEIGLSHFSGTSRDPMFVPALLANGAPALRPYYPLIDQTAIDAQAIFGDWAFKLEGFRRSGFGDTYFAFNAGFERTLVGVLGTRADLGIVAEYMHDERDDEAFNTLFEHDVALGARLQLNDHAGTQALLGIILDTETNDRMLSLESSRRVGETWALSVEGRVFSGGKSLPEGADLATLLSDEYKSAMLQTEDYLQVELKKFF